MSDLDALISAARLPEATYELCLRGDLQAGYEDARRRQAAAAAEDTLAPVGGDIEAELELLRDEMRAATVTLKLRALPRRQWHNLAREHPPRDGDHGDALCGFNRDELFPAAALACIYEPQITAGQWSKLVDVMTDGQYEALMGKVAGLNMRQVSVPLS